MSRAVPLAEKILPELGPAVTPLRRNSAGSSPDAVTHVMLVAEHPLIRDGVSRLIDTAPDLALVGDTASAAVVPTMVKKLQPDIVIVDVGLHDVNGMLLVQRLGGDSSFVTVVLSAHEDRAYVRQAFDGGAKAYVSKRSPGDNLLQAIRAAAGGGTYIDPAVAGQFVVGPRSAKSARQGRTDLTERETEVVRLLALGNTNKQIAAQLGLNVKSVETYRARACQKLDMRTRAELVRYAASLGWLETIC